MPTQRSLRRVLVPTLLATAIVAVVALAAARPNDPWADANAPARHALGTLGPDFLELPEGDSVYSGLIVRPEIDSWLSVRPSRDYRVLLLHTTGDEWDEQTQILVEAVERWASEDDHVLLRVKPVDNPHTFPDEIEAAARSANADLVIGAGVNLVSAMALISASFIYEQQFLMLGGEIAEPTENATSADWDEHAFQGQMDDPGRHIDPSSVTPHRAYDALRAGVAAVLGGFGGTVVRVPER